MHLNETHDLATELMTIHGLKQKGWRLDFTRAVNQFGVCRYNTKTIALSIPLTVLNNEEEVRDTILHEIAHALAPRGAGHGKEWKRIAKAIGARPERCYSSAKVVMPPAKYVGECPKCESRIHRHRRKNLSCGKCSPRVYNPDVVFKWRNND